MGSQLQFVVMLRNPLDRLKSLYNCCICPRDRDGVPFAPRCRNSSFVSDLRKDMKSLLSDPPEYSDWLWGAHYGQHLEEWFAHFDAKQLYIIPFGSFTRGGGDKVCQDL